MIAHTAQYKWDANLYASVSMKTDSTSPTLTCLHKAVYDYSLALAICNKEKVTTPYTYI